MTIPDFPDSTGIPKYCDRRWNGAVRNGSSVSSRFTGKFDILMRTFYPWHGFLQDGTPDRAEQAEEQEEGGYGKQHVGEGIEELTGTARSAS